jgi:dolichyl-phosphate beta-glucosyltransferase
MLSVIIPAYNEERRLGPSLERIFAHLRKRRKPFEVLVVDDGSSDSTAPLVRRLAKKHRGLRLLMNGGNRGKGASVRHGVEQAKGGLILMSDADLSTPIEALSDLEAALGSADIAIGSRAIDRGRITRRQPLFREAGGRLFNLLVRALTVGGISDTQCGFKLFRADSARRIFALQRVPRFGFDVEALYLARKMGLKIAEISVAWENSPETKVRPVRDGLRTFLDLALIRWYDLRGFYGRPLI